MLAQDDGMMRAAVVAGLGSCVPPKVVTNDDLARRLDTTDEWIRTRIGVITRHVVEPGTATSDLAVLAARRALRSAGTPAVGAVVLATTTPDRPCPGTGLIASGLVDSLVVIGADTYSTIVDPQDRLTAVIFGDGAGAVVLRAGSPDEPGALGQFDLGSHGQLADLITVPAGGSRQRSTREPAATGDEYFRMSGREVFANAVTRMSASSLAALRHAGWKASDVDRIAAHQANTRILTAVSDELGVNSDRVLCNIHRVGNTSAASIPLVLDDGLRGGVLQPGHRVLMTAFGGGLTWGSVTLTWPELTPSGPRPEYDY